MTANLAVHYSLDVMAPDVAHKLERLLTGLRLVSPGMEKQRLKNEEEITRRAVAIWRANIASTGSSSPLPAQIA
jgi:hypothetical protein